MTTYLLGILNFGWQEVVLILLVALLLFGGKKLPELARGLARALRGFKEEMRDVKADVADAIEEPPETETPKQDTPEAAESDDEKDST